MKQQLNELQLKEIQLTSLSEEEAKKIDGGGFWDFLFGRKKSSKPSSRTQTTSYDGPPDTIPQR
jgi:hypothetical protein